MTTTLRNTYVFRMISNFISKYSTNEQNVNSEMVNVNKEFMQKLSTQSTVLKIFKY